MRKLLAVFAVGVLASATSAVAIAQDQVQNELNGSIQIMKELTGPHTTAGIPNDVLKGAKCVAVIPKMLKGGFVLGIQHGAGIATCRLAGGRWSPPAPFDLSGASFGAQIGGEEMGYVMMIMNDKGMQALNSGHFKLGAGVNAAAGPVGRDASASGGWDAAILTYARAKGIYAGATLSGDELNQDHKATKELYGKEEPLSAILNGKVKMPAQGPARKFVETISHDVQSAAK
ncbi:MAG: lipid-binding SYLF domain-containing protein [Acidobacteriota bacterium]|jgi:lipid-binding SYLF domain-containing protein